MKKGKIYKEAQEIIKSLEVKNIILNAPCEELIPAQPTVLIEQIRHMMKYDEFHS